MALPQARVILKLFMFLVLIGGILLIIPYAGWLGAQFVLVFTLEILFEKRKWAFSLATAFIAMIAIYCLFELGLGVRLPRGIFE